MLKVAIIDDEQKSRETVSIFIQKNFDAIKIVGEAWSVESGTSLLNNTKPDLVFLDLGLPDGHGFEILETQNKLTFETIFITAYDHYAIDAFEYSAIDYLLKPLNQEKLVKAVNKAKDRLHDRQTQVRFDDLLEKIKLQRPKDRISLPTAEGMEFIPVKEIIRCEAQSNYTDFYLKNGQKKMVSKTLKEFEQVLEHYNFFRVHHAHLINVNYVQKYFKGKGGYILMSDKSSVPVSSRKRQDFLDFMRKS